MELYGIAIVNLVLFLIYLWGYLNPWIYLGLTIAFLSIMIYISDKRVEKLKELVREKTDHNILNNFDGLAVTYVNRDRMIALYVFAGLIVSFYFLYDVSHVGHWTKHIMIGIEGVTGGVIYSVFAQFGFIPYNADPFSFKVKDVIDVSDVSDGRDVSSDYNEALVIIRKGFEDNLETEAVDSNDLDIARMESELKNYNSKIDGYMLESVLIGALTFSGFLGIITTGYANSESIQKFITDLRQLPFQIPGDILPIH